MKYEASGYLAKHIDRVFKFSIKASVPREYQKIIGKVELFRECLLARKQGINLSRRALKEKIHKKKTESGEQK